MRETKAQMAERNRVLSAALDSMCEQNKTLIDLVGKLRASKVVIAYVAGGWHDRKITSKIMNSH